MSVGGLALDASTRNPIILLLDPSQRRQVPIWIDHAQAHHIMAGIKKLYTDSPLSHDLMVSILSLGDLKLKKVVIHSIENGNFQAVLQISKNSNKKDSNDEKEADSFEIKARPSDAIALAVRASCGIWMLEEVVSKASIAVDINADEEDQNEFRQFLQGISPSSLINHFNGND